uniref:Anaphase-promoting complex subunit 4 WD40 domain-containing protein n=2 Tax=Guillardia theta TaxID=55529 RepID=A0A7S4N2K8_GUITH|mmetsp:Transcript_15866/g.53073  ORF Transcript_15866/g.53073 Transcript_15866/m.53073 type:complete len:191 (+) Transcript_15866:707-1279(+)
MTKRTRKALPHLKCRSRVMKGHSGSVLSCAFEPKTGEHAISTSYNGEIKLWKIGRHNGTAVEELLRSSKLIASPVICCAWKPDSSMIAAGTEAAVCFLLQATDLNVLWRVDVGTAYVTEVAFMNFVDKEEKQECLVAAAGDSSPLCWKLQSGERRSVAGKCLKNMVCFAKIDCQRIICGCIGNNLQILSI